MVTEKQKQATTRNAQLSTGPVLPEGKTIVSRTAIKHSIFAKDLVINVDDGGSDDDPIDVPAVGK